MRFCGGVRCSGGCSFGGGDVLFTDVEGSTRRWEGDADAMRLALAAHDEVLRGAVEAHVYLLSGHAHASGALRFVRSRRRR